MQGENFHECDELPLGLALGDEEISAKKESYEMIPVHCTKKIQTFADANRTVVLFLACVVSLEAPDASTNVPV